MPRSSSGHREKKAFKSWIGAESVKALRQCLFHRFTFQNGMFTIGNPGHLTVAGGFAFCFHFLFLRFCRTKRYLITSQTKVKRVSRTQPPNHPLFFSVKGKVTSLTFTSRSVAEQTKAAILHHVVSSLQRTYVLPELQRASPRRSIGIFTSWPGQKSRRSLVSKAFERTLMRQKRWPTYSSNQQWRSGFSAWRTSPSNLSRSDWTPQPRCLSALVIENYFPNLSCRSAHRSTYLLTHRIGRTSKASWPASEQGALLSNEQKRSAMWTRWMQ